MQSVRKAILRHVSVTNSARPWSITKAGPSLGGTMRQMCTSACTSSDHLMARVIGMVKKYDRIDSGKVTETADFQKDLCLDSLDRVELVMAIEQEFNIEIPDDKADKFTCCADVVKYIMSEADQKIAENS
ncbi:acyl carrier protein 3, mitochondrial isoform X2 [Magnolia sinica]|nr:acyl carrier protein 3, mitochondrial isoform X2 [Magnolia sinica]